MGRPVSMTIRSDRSSGTLPSATMWSSMATSADSQSAVSTLPTATIRSPCCKPGIRPDPGDSGRRFPACPLPAGESIQLVQSFRVAPGPPGHHRRSRLVRCRMLRSPLARDSAHRCISGPRHDVHPGLCSKGNSPGAGIALAILFDHQCRLFCQYRAPIPDG